MIGYTQGENLSQVLLLQTTKFFSPSKSTSTQQINHRLSLKSFRVKTRQIILYSFQYYKHEKKKINDIC